MTYKLHEVHLCESTSPLNLSYMKGSEYRLMLLLSDCAFHSIFTLKTFPMMMPEINQVCYTGIVQPGEGCY